MALDFGDFNLGGGGPSVDTEPTFDLGNPGGFHIDMPDLSGFSFPDISGGDKGGGGGFDFKGAMRDWIGPGFQIGKTGLDAFLGIRQQQANADYQKRLDAYNKQRAESEAAYNKQVQDYLTKRSAWEQEMMGFAEEQQGQFGEAFGAFKEQMGSAMGDAQNILQKYLSAAEPLFKQSQDLLEPAIAALAKGEVPPQLAPILDQAKNRARAAAVNNLVSAGMSPEAASAAVTPQIDQQAQTMLIQMAQSMLGGGLQVGGQGLQALQGAGAAVGQEGNLAIAMLDPIQKEFQLMMTALGNMFGGFPGLASPGGAPAAPVA